MYLYQIPQNSKIYEEVSDGSTFFTFHHLDGMYSYCTSEKGAVLHLGVASWLVKYKDGYKLAKRKQKEKR